MTIEDQLTAPPRPLRAWFVGEGPVPGEEPTDAGGLALMRAQADELPLVAGLRAALDLIGDGLRLTTAGHPYVADVKRYVDPTGRSSIYSRHCSLLGFVPMLTMLHDLGWVQTEERRILPVPGSPSEGGLDVGSEGFLDAVRAALVAALRPYWPRPGQWWGDEEDAAAALPDVLLLATVEGGVELPDIPGCMAHCEENTAFLVSLIAHPRICGVPLDAHSGHVSRTALEDLADCERTMSQLVSRGVISSPGRGGYGDHAGYEDYGWEKPVPRFTAPLLIRGAVAALQ